jgi:putative ABC transport system permease protein
LRSAIPCGLGEREFRLMAALEREPDNATAGFGLGPRTIVATEALEGSGLIAPGSLFSTRYRLDFPPGADLAALQQAAQDALPDSGLRWTDARNGAPGVAEFVQRLGAFLVLVGLSGLAVGGVGISAALRAYLAGKTQTIATLRTLGAAQGTVFMVYFLQVGVLALLGIALGLILGVGAPIALAPILEARLPVPAVFAPYTGPMAEAALYSLLTVLIFTLWPLARAREVRAAALYRDALGQARRLPALQYLVITAALIAVLLAAAAWFSGNLMLTLWTAGGIGGSLIALALAAIGIRYLARKLRVASRGRPALGWALAAISGPGSSAGPGGAVAWAWGCRCWPPWGRSIRTCAGLSRAICPSQAPAFFFVDIQRDQMPLILERLEGDEGVSRIDHAPMLRGIITDINGRPAEEVAGSHWVLEGDRGVSYAGRRARAHDRHRVASGGGPITAARRRSALPQEEAEEMGLSLGDELTVNILGRDVTATLTSFREVDFSTAGMGFIMVMNEAALAGAPHTFIATVYADAASEGAILRDISEAYPNVTAISVRDAIDRVSGLLAGLASATAWGAAATLVTGFLVLIGAAAADQRARSFEAAVLKTLGATRARILTGLALRAGLLGAAAGIVALGAGVGGGWAVSHYIMDTALRWRGARASPSSRAGPRSACWRGSPSRWGRCRRNRPGCSGRGSKVILSQIGPGPTSGGRSATVGLGGLSCKTVRLRASWTFSCALPCGEVGRGPGWSPGHYIINRGDSPDTPLLRRLGILLHRRAGAHQMPVAIGVIHPVHRRPVFVHPERPRRETGLFAAYRADPSRARGLPSCGARFSAGC